MAESTNLMEEMIDRGMTNLTDELASWVLRINTMCAEKDAEIERLKAERGGWEVEGFIDRLARRDETNSERLVLEAISHLRVFSRNCDALRESNREREAEIARLTEIVDQEHPKLIAEIERLKAALDQGRINDQCVIDEAIAAAMRIRDAEIARLNTLNATLLDHDAAKIERLNAKIERLQTALSFAQSVIKSGEPWTERCEEMIGGALSDKTR